MVEEFTNWMRTRAKYTWRYMSLFTPVGGYVMDYFTATTMLSLFKVDSALWNPSFRQLGRRQHRWAPRSDGAASYSGENLNN